LIPYIFSIIVSALKAKFRIHIGGLFMINNAYLTTGLPIKTLFKVLKGGNKYPCEHSSKTEMSQNKEGIVDGSLQR